jgi:hypothetical protein
MQAYAALEIYCHRRDFVKSYPITEIHLATNRKRCGALYEDRASVHLRHLYFPRMYHRLQIDDQG